MPSSEFIAIQKQSQKRQAKKVKKVKERLQNETLKVPYKPAAKKRTISQNFGVIYLGHLPHGFYEKEIKGYFLQFGKVTGVHVSRSEKTGKPKGFAFVKFQDADVAKIAAETMNNYLLNKKLLKAEVVPPEKIPERIFKKQKWTEHNHPGVVRRKQQRLQYNKRLKETECKKVLSNRLNSVNKMLSKLRNQGLEQDVEIVNKPDNFPEKVEAKRSVILEIDPSDDDVSFNLPPGAFVKTMKKKQKTTPKAVSEVAKNPIKKIKAVQQASPKKVTKIKMGLKQAIKDKAAVVKDKSKIIKKKKA